MLERPRTDRRRAARLRRQRSCPLRRAGRQRGCPLPSFASSWAAAVSQLQRGHRERPACPPFAPQWRWAPSPPPPPPPPRHRPRSTAGRRHPCPLPVRPCPRPRPPRTGPRSQGRRASARGQPPRAVPPRATVPRPPRAPPRPPRALAAREGTRRTRPSQCGTNLRSRETVVAGSVAGWRSGGGQPRPRGQGVGGMRA